ncbi:hypothetical protein [Lelliottia sp. JS-SCA-14]|uniref:hypothetical protein n=1 Tax=Lelliottia sp. JS-SCA-14 TaxID=3110110 RepID=UPI002D780485|nr:hypothetical protein [Lelliottia sp. JS-SCA-14]
MTFTKEQLTSEIETLEHFATNLKWTNAKGAQSLLFAAEVMRQALAGMEAEPLTDVERAELQGYRNAQQVVPEDFDSAWQRMKDERFGCNEEWARKFWDACRAAMQSGAVLSPMQPMVIDSVGTLRFKENPLVRKLLDVATGAGYGLNAMALEDHSPDDRMQLAQLIGYSLSGYGDLSYVSDESYNRAAAAAPQQECKHEFVYGWHSYGRESGYQCRLCGKLQEAK